MDQGPHERVLCASQPPLHRLSTSTDSLSYPARRSGPSRKVRGSSSAVLEGVQLTRSSSRRRDRCQQPEVDVRHRHPQRRPHLERPAPVRPPLPPVLVSLSPLTSVSPRAPAGTSRPSSQGRSASSTTVVFLVTTARRSSSRSLGPCPCVVSFRAAPLCSLSLPALGPSVTSVLEHARRCTRRAGTTSTRSSRSSSTTTACRSSTVRLSLFARRS